MQRYFTVNSTFQYSCGDPRSCTNQKLGHPADFRTTTGWRKIPRVCQRHDPFVWRSRRDYNMSASACRLMSSSS